VNSLFSFLHRRNRNFRIFGFLKLICFWFLIKVDFCVSSFSRYLDIRNSSKFRSFDSILFCLFIFFSSIPVRILLLLAAHRIVSPPIR